MKICSKHNPGRWLAIGIAIGAGLGASMHDMAMGVGIGAGLGSLLMALANRRPPRDSHH